MWRRTVAALVVAVGLCAVGRSEQPAPRPQTKYHVVLQVNGSDGSKWIEWSATDEPPGSVNEVVGPLRPWTLEYRWELSSPRTVHVTANNVGSWVACSISVNDVQKVAHRDDTPFGAVSCSIEVG
jgi:hypothetical protein